MTAELLLEVRGLATWFETPRGTAKVLDGLDFEIGRGEILGLVGESGSGKSVTAYSIERLVPPPGRVVAGEVRLEGRDLLALSEKQMREVRGKEISMIFQDPRGFLEPTRAAPEAKPGHVPSSCSRRSACRRPSGSTARTRTSCPAGWRSAR
jgi:ABC-type dipeptide/oligopeptide/nickel transport system ATPase component